MKPYQASLVNAIVLITMSAWAYFTSATPSITALIPALIGIILLILNPGVKKEGKVPAHIAVVLTFVILLGLIKPMMGAIESGNSLGITRVTIMIITTIVALVAFIQSFIAVRKKRQLEEQQSSNA